ncbi:glycosyltransferase family 2 protein [Shewanella algae]|uniref:glycosyltransferase family 2 protein n=1 Tax=Shewanella algae TaxID=38313 RepID=UPI00313C420E
MMFTASLAITTYNWPEALELSLESVLKQTVLPKEVLVADDGSTKPTRELIERLKPRFNAAGCPLIHCWQEDKGFRAARGRNLALAQASGDYMIYIDQDMVMEKHFIQDHIEVAEKGVFVAGIRVKINEKYTRRMIEKKDFWPRLFGPGVKFDRSLGTVRSKFLRCGRRSPVEITGDKVFGCNMAFWRTDAIAINGFNHEFIGWGPEDKEFYIRLANRFGTKRRLLKHAAVAFHLHHPELSRAQLKANQDLYWEMVNKKLQYCRLGLNEFFDNSHNIPQHMETLLYLGMKQDKAA